MEWQDVVSNYKVYDLEESILASGLPMRTNANVREITDKDIQRMHNLSAASDNGNQAHGQALSGILVSFDLTFSNKAWVEAERYRFLTFVSSQSTMHRITKFDLDNQYIDYVDPRIIDIMKSKVLYYNKLEQEIQELKNKQNSGPITKALIQERTRELKNKYLEILYSNPAGFKITARMTTNYRCLKNIYIQRKNHRLPEWVVFCEWIETLPYFEELINTCQHSDNLTN